MSTSAESTARAPARGHVVLVVAVGAVLLASVVLRFVTQSELWFDEALSVNIARLPIGDLQEALRHDGAPPLYYVLLHYWIEAFGTRRLRRPVLSGLFSVATLPAIWFAGRRVGGTRVAWLALLVLATSPYAIRYATEARMYALVMFLVAWGYLALRRALERPSLFRLAIVAVIAAALMYAQYWSFYLLAVVGVWLLYRVWRPRGPDDRRAAMGVLVSFVAALILFAPWLSTFRYQLSHTGTPWGDARVPWSGVAGAFESFMGGADHGEGLFLVLALILLPLLALFGRGVDDRHVDLDLRTRPAVRTEASSRSPRSCSGWWRRGPAGRRSKVATPPSCSRSSCWSWRSGSPCSWTRASASRSWRSSSRSGCSAGSATSSTTARRPSSRPTSSGRRRSRATSSRTAPTRWVPTSAACSTVGRRGSRS
jgi:hypothetical protein